MATLSNREKLFVRIFAIGVPVYLIFFFFVAGPKKSASGQGDYADLLRQAEQLKTELKPYQARAGAVATLMEKYQMDPAKLSKSTAVGQASAAIQKVATSGGMQLGPIRESAGRASAFELASIKLEGTGPLPAAISFLKRLETLGYPLLIESVQINPDSKGPGFIKLTLTITVLDFEKWKPAEVPRA